LIFFTGAGISTSAGIPDFRGPQGVWTLKAQGKDVSRDMKNTCKAYPTLTHMSLVKLQNIEKMKFLISQNTDGLHRKSGIDGEMLSELHGNSNMEICKKCKKKCLRDFVTRSGKKNHITGRKCVDTSCNGVLCDTIVNFGDNLPEDTLQKANDEANLADLCIVLGSSLRVYPACDIPEMVSNHGGKLVIVNLQNTPYDEMATVSVKTKCDQFMEEVMLILDIEIPPFVLQRRLLISKKQEELFINGIETDGMPVQFLKEITFNFDNDEESQITLNGEYEMFFNYPLNGRRGDLNITFQTMGNYDETKYTFVYHVKEDDNDDTKVLLSWDPYNQTWSHEFEEIKVEENNGWFWWVPNFFNM